MFQGLLWYLDDKTRIIFEELARCGLSNLSVYGLHNVTNEKSLSRDVVFSRLNRVPMSDMIYTCNRILRLSAKQARMQGVLPDIVDIAIDFTSIEHWCEDDNAYVLPGNGKYLDVYKYAVVSAVGKGFFIALGILPVSKDAGKEDVVGGLLELAMELVEPRYILMDREFVKTALFDECDSWEVEYIVPAKKTPGIRQVYRDCKEQGLLHSLYYMRRKYGGCRYKQVHLYFKDDPKREYVAVISNRETSPEEILMLFETYRMRWNIENNFKMDNNFMAKTCSKNPAYRLLLETIALLLANLWKIIQKYCTGQFWSYMFKHCMITKIGQAETMRIPYQTNQMIDKIMA